MSKHRDLLYVLLIVFTVWPVSIWITWSNKADQSAPLKLASHDDLMASHYNTSYLGCLALELLRPDVVAVGDSHAYSGLNVQVLDKFFGSGKVGACFLPQNTLDSTLMIFHHMDDKGIRPRRLIFVVSHGAFFDVPGAVERLPSHRQLLFDADFREKEMSKWQKAIDVGEPPFGRSDAEVSSFVERHEPRWGQVRNDDILRVVSRFGKKA
jgi:hypothetical protein